MSFWTVCDEKLTPAGCSHAAGVLVSEWSVKTASVGYSVILSVGESYL